MLNHATKAREALAKIIAMTRDPLPLMARDAEWLDRLLHEGVKFTLPDNGELLAGGSLGVEDCLSLGRLPFPVTIVEFRIEEGHFPIYEDAPIPALARLAIGIDLGSPIGRDLVLRQWPGAIARWDRTFGEPFQGGHKPAAGMVVISIDDASHVDWEVSAMKQVDWMPGWAAIFVPYDQTPSVTDHLAHLDVGQTVLTEGNRESRPFKALLSLWPLGTNGVHAPAVDDAALKGTAEFSLEVSALAELCAISSCRNVSRVLEEPPAKLCKARTARGKLPLYASYTLSLNPAAPSADRGLAAGAATGRTVSTHLRRGHIRRLESRNVWVNSTIVAPFSPRRVDKGYHLRAVTPHHP